MSLQSLAVVELQLVMQCLDRLSLLALARCSRALLAAASHPFPWQHIESDLACAGSELLQCPLVAQHLRTTANWAVAGIRAATSSGASTDFAAPIPSPLTMARRYNSSLPRFGSCQVTWSLTSSETELRAQVAAVAGLPHVSKLSITPSSSGKSARLSPAHVALLVDGLLRHSAATLTQLHLDNNGLGDDGAAALAQLVRESARLRMLLLDYTAISAAGLRALWEAVEQSSSLAVLSLSGMPITDDVTVLAITTALSTSTLLQHVRLCDCEIGEAGAVALANALRGLPLDSRLKVLDLSYNNISDEGAAALVDALIHWSCCRRNNPKGVPAFHLLLLENERLTAAILAARALVRVELSHSLAG